MHARATTYEDCKAFCGSKYIQSDLGNSFKEVESDLRQGLTVLFTGSPCQVSAINIYLKNKGCPVDLLYTVDIVCHGAPQSTFWKNYKAWLENKEKSKLVNFSFRYKPKGWKGYPTMAEFENGRRYENSFCTSHYMTIFRKGFLMRQSCFSCKYPGNFESDITIADFWGVELCMPEIPARDGVSVMICHTEKGRYLIQNMNTDICFLKEIKDNEYLKYNHNLIKKTHKPEQYDQFWSDYKNKGMEYVLREYGGNSFKGKCKFYGIRILRDSGLMGVMKKVLKKA